MIRFLVCALFLFSIAGFAQTVRAGEVSSSETPYHGQTEESADVPGEATESNPTVPLFVDQWEKLCAAYGEMKRTADRAGKTISEETGKAFGTACGYWNKNSLSSKKEDRFFRTLPPLYFKARGMPVCDLIENLRNEAKAWVEKDGEAAELRNATEALADSCGKGGLKSGMLASVLTPILLKAVTGLGEFAIARAQEELMSYALETLGKRTCADPFFGKLFPTTCRIVLAEESSTLPRTLLAGLLKKELNNLPTNLLAAVMEQKGVLSPAEREDREAVSIVLTQLAQHLGRTQRTLDIRNLADTVYNMLHDKVSDDTTGFLKNGCDLSAETPQPACLIALYATIVKTGMDDPGEMLSDISVWQEKAAVDFCDLFGAPGKTTEGACLYGENYLNAYHAGVIGFISAAGRLMEEMKDLEILEPEKRIAASHDILIRFLTAIRPDDLAAKQRTLFVLAEGTIDLSYDILEGNEARVPSHLLSLLFAFKDAAGLPVDLTKLDGVAFLLDLAAAKDAKEAKEIIEKAAEPIGSYKRKYQTPVTAGVPLVAVNFFTGFLAGYQWNIDPPKNSSTKVMGNYAAVSRLTAPLGLDISWNGGARARDWHFGLFIPLIDPLALTAVDETGEFADFKDISVLGSIVSPGLFFRVGVYRSPFVVMIGANYQPWFTIDDWRGALQVGAQVAVDIPLWVF